MKISQNYIVTIFLIKICFFNFIYSSDAKIDNEIRICCVCMEEKPKFTEIACHHPLCNTCMNAIEQSDLEIDKVAILCPLCRIPIKLFRKDYALRNLTASETFTSSQVLGMLQLGALIPIHFHTERIRNQESRSLIELHIDFMKAIITKRFDLIKTILKNNIFLDAVFKSKYMSGTAMHYAINKDFFPLLRFLVKNYPNIDINKQNLDGDSPLIFACRYNKINIIKFLLNHPNINLNLQNNHGNSALHYIIWLYHDDLLTKVIKLGADTHAKDINGHNALMLAVTIDNLFATQELIEISDISAKNNFNQDVFEIAQVHNASQDILDILQEHKNAKANRKRKQEDTAKRKRIVMFEN